MNWLRCTTAGISTLILCGCASSQKAAKLAADIGQASIAYEHEVDAKVNAEKTFYVDELVRLRQTLGGSMIITGQGAATNEWDVTQSLPYLRIRTRAEREARLVAEKIVVADKPEAMRAILDYADNGVTQEQSDYLGYLKRQRELVTTLSAKLADIEQQKNHLVESRKYLATLSVRTNALDQLENALKVGIAAYDLMKSTNAAGPAAVSTP